MRIRSFASVVVATIIAGAACDSATSPPPGGSLGELARQESMWESRGLRDYLFDYHYQFAGVIDAAQIFVSGDSVAAALDLANGKALSLDPENDWPTVEDLFARAKMALSSGKVDVTVEYDPDLGYPTRIDVSPQAATPAGESSTRAGNLKRMVVLSPQ